MLAIAHSFAPAAGPLKARRHRSSEVDLCWIAAQLGLTHHAPRTIIAKVRLLASQSGFPLPKTPRFVGGVRLRDEQAIDARSIWDRDSVERWLDDDRPPAEGAALAEIRRSSVADELAKRAASLVLVA